MKKWKGAKKRFFFLQKENKIFRTHLIGNFKSPISIILVSKHPMCFRNFKFDVNAIPDIRMLLKKKPPFCILESELMRFHS